MNKIILIFSALFLISMIALMQCSEPEPEPPEINYVIKARTATRLYLIDTGLDIKIPLISNEKGEFLHDFENAKENCTYIKLTGGYYTLHGFDYYYESIIEIENGNRNATYGVTGIEIIYFITLNY